MILTTAITSCLLACAVTAVLAFAAACGSSGSRKASPPSDECAAPEARQHGMQSHGMHSGVYGRVEQWAQRFDNPARDVEQRPDEVIRALELEPTMTVADVGAGTGYFAVRLARALPDGAVIATDLEPEMVRYLDERARREQLPNLRAVRATTTTSGLAANSVDAILVVHVWHHITARSCYARDLAAALRPGGKLVIVDFPPDAPKGPPAHHRLSSQQVVAELAREGFTATVSPIQLPGQYIIEARHTR